jgi:putative ABC transport system permease protein
LPALKDETPGAGGRRSLLREGLIVVQVAVSVLLLAGSGLLVRSFLVLHRGLGFDPDAVVLLRLRPSLVGYTNERAWTFQREVVRRLEALPGVVSASQGGTPPFPGWARQTQIEAPGAGNHAGEALRTGMAYVSPRYFETLGSGVVRGREFDDRDTPGGGRVAIVNETLARRLWPDGSAVGQSLSVSGQPHEIVGVVRDLQFVNALERPQPMVYLDYWQQNRADNWSSDAQLHVRISGPRDALLTAIPRAIAAIDPDVPVSDARTLGERLDYEFSKVRLARTLLLGFGALAFVLSTIGLYAALTFAIGQRRREMAIRMALGANRNHVATLVFRRGGVIVGLGLAAGLLTAVLGAGPLLANLLYGVSPRDPFALLAGPLVLVVVALAAIWPPARRAMTMDATAVLRSE